MSHFLNYIRWRFIKEATFIRKRKQRAAKKTKTKVEKLEELLTTLRQYSNWIDQNIDITPAVPIAKIESMQRLYFPEFSRIISDVLKTGIRYEFAKRRDRMIDIEDKFYVSENIENLRIKYTISFNSCIIELEHAKHELQ
jgi:hypothetical protein